MNLVRYSVEQKAASGVPIGTIIAWISTQNPSYGIWLDCNGQSCAAYTELVAVLGKNTVPDLRGRFLEGAAVPGTLKEAGVPNIEGKLYAHSQGRNDNFGAFYESGSGVVALGARWAGGLPFLYLMLHVVILFMVQVTQFNRLLSLYDILSRQHNSMKKSRRACEVLRVICF